MHSIITIEQLITELNDTPSDEFSKVLKRIEIPKSLFEPYISLCDKGYTRNCIARTKNYEIILLCWDKDIQTPIHDHGGQDCWVYQVSGTIEECRYKNEKLEEPFVQVISEGGLTYMNDNMGFHTIKNISGTRAKTLHIYNSPIDSCNIYDEESNDFNLKIMKYDTFIGEEVS